MKWFWRRKKLPVPGSEEAARAGCLCPVHINNVGREKPKGGWSMRSSCPMHSEQAKKPKKKAWL